ncbi:MAG: hypothetical protein LQ342_001435 [Letrouitia transgressa]|nr:MAG: hypothetical protein LQ342_001435 [Letrouitia transgressa]
MQEGLLQRSCEEGQPQEQFKDIAFQLALCYELAFGVQRDVDKSQKWLTLSGRGALHVSAELNKLHSNNQSRSEVQGLINDSRVVNITDRYATAGQLGDALPLYTIESEGKLASLGPLADPTLVLQSYLTELLQLDGQRSKAKTLLQQTLNACDREWGSDSTWSSSLRLQLSRIMAAQGDMLGAISLAEGLLQLRTNADNNVDILQALSSYYGLICDYGRSVQYSDQAWQIRKGQFGETHPLTMNALELLSYATTNTNMTEAEIMESEVLDWRRKVLGEHSDVVLQTMKNLAFVRANTRGKELEGIEMQQEILLKLKEVPEPSWTQIVWGTDRLAWMQLKANQLEEAIKTRSQLLGQKDDLLSCQQGLALLGNHAKNLKDAGRIREAEDLRADVLEKIPIILKPIPNISNPIIRGVGCAFQVSAEFDDEATTLYVRNVRLWKHLSRELGEFHERTVSILRFLLLLSNEAHIVQATVHFLGLQHPTTQLAVVRLKNKLSEYVRNVVQIEDCVSETMDWMQTRIALLE